MQQMWSFAARRLAEQTPVVLVAIVDATGSVPGKPGAMMMVTPDEVAGTVGGGIAESAMMTCARSPRAAIELTSFRHTPETGSLCLGTQTIALCPLGPKERPVVEAVAAALESAACGVVSLSPAGLTFTRGASRPRSFEQRDGSWSFAVTVGPSDTLFLVGGGHVALALSRVMATLPFRIVILDDREGLPTMEQNIHAHETRVIEYGRVREHVDDGELSWVIIMTYGHHHDEAVLERLVDRSYRYLGLMGSRAKIGQIFSNLRSRGVAQADLDRVHAPVGLPIGSHSPEEIAVSIAAQLVQVRNTATSTLRPARA